MSPRPRSSTVSLSVVSSLLHNVARRRRPLAAALLGLALIVVASSLRPSPPGTPVVVSARPLPSGTVLSTADLTLATWGANTLPAGMFADPTDLVGKQLSGAVSQREPITGPRLVGNSLTSATGADQVAYPVRLADGQVASLLTPGAVVDVIAANDQGQANVVASSAPVLAVPNAQPGASSFDGALIVVSVSPTTATRLAAAAASGPLSVALRS